MDPTSYAVTFACYNQLGYTRQCIDSLVRTGLDLSRLVVVDNGSTDDTREFLEGLPLGGRVFNQGNLGCGVAWNQGALALQAEWTVVMNNDVVVSTSWLHDLIGAAQNQGLRLASPAMVEGEHDYDFEAFVQNDGQRMKHAVRRGSRHAVCMLIHKSVWAEVGYFQPVPKLWGYEDTLFFHELDKAAVPTGVVGSSWIHHFGSVTQSAIKRERGLTGKQGLSARNSHRLLGLSFWQRKLMKFQRELQLSRWKRQELEQFDMTLHGQRENGHFTWR